MLSVIVPAFNELATIDEILAAVRAVDIDKEILVIDDGSTDGTRQRLDAISNSAGDVRVFHHAENQGKGAALRTGFAAARGRFVVIQDADLEYDPADYSKLLRPLLDGKADVVFGTRFLGGDHHRMLYFWHSVGNRLLTCVSNIFTNMNISDMETGYKAFRREVIQDIRIEEDRFGVEPELAAKIASYRIDDRPLRIYEVGISYHGRRYEEGKKIGWRDGLHGLWCIIKYNWLR